MHLKRWITALVALPFLVLLIVKGGTLMFAAAVSAIGLLALYEYEHIISGSECPPDRNLISALGFLICPLTIFAAYYRSFEAIVLLVTFNLLISGAISLRRFKSDARIVERLSKQVLGIIYVPLLLSFLVFIRNSTDGIVWIFFLIVMVFSGDIGAFYVGTWVGRHKLCPSVSPNKTIEGAIGGLSATLVAGTLYALYFLPALPSAKVTVLCIITGVAGQIGDLFESECKRYGHIKDSGTILPGHGGILDRIDALLFAAPVIFYFKQYLL